MSKSPAFQFYPADFLSDARVKLMNFEQKGIYIELICHCWIEGFIPSDIEMLSRLVGLSQAEFEEHWKWIWHCFEVHKKDEKKLIHLRLEKERKKQKEHSKKRSEAGAKGAQKRWASKPEPDGKCYNNAKQMPMAKNSFSSSSSSSSSEEINISSQSRFSDFWEEWPVKADKKEAESVWKKKKLDSQADYIIERVQALKGTRRWEEGYIPGAPTFLRKERWEDDIESLNLGGKAQAKNNGLRVTPASERKGGSGQL